MTTAYLRQDLERDEGLRLTAYPDPDSPRGQQLAKPPAKRVPGWETLPGAPWTIGYGHCGPEVHEGLVWTPDQAAGALAADVAHACRLLDRNAAWWRDLNDARQDVLANLCFNMGWLNPAGTHGLGTFRNTLAAIHRGDWQAAHDGLTKSAWAREVGRRGARLATQLLTGERATA